MVNREVVGLTVKARWRGAKVFKEVSVAKKCVANLEAGKDDFSMTGVTGGGRPTFRLVL